MNLNNLGTGKLLVKTVLGKGPDFMKQWSRTQQAQTQHPNKNIGKPTNNE